ncbi:MAG: hypothetical protein MZU91_14940 [Desulfosudis oleivorans]|nr:hypothetical protein [Desulfosudis oleivorans]
MLETESIKRNPMFCLSRGADHQLHRRPADLDHPVQQLRGGRRRAGRQPRGHDPVHPRNPGVPGAAGGLSSCWFIREHRLSAVSILILGAGLAATGFFPTFAGIAITTLVSSFGFHYYETTNMSLTLQYFKKARIALGVRQTHQPGRRHQHRHRPADLGDDVVSRASPRCTSSSAS